MGLLNYIKSGGSVAIPLELEYESISDDAIMQILKFYRRLVIRGNNIDRDVYSSRSRLWLKDEAKKVYFYKLGSLERKKTGTDYEENYYQLIYEEELWFVHCQKCFTEPVMGRVTAFEVSYIPQKIGRESDNEKEARDVAFTAMEALEDKEKLSEYMGRLSAVLAKDSMEEMITLTDTWYDMIFAEEGSRAVRDANERAKLEKIRRDPAYSIEVLSELEEKKHFMFLEKYLPTDYFMYTKFCAKCKDAELRCIKLLSKKDTEEVVSAEGKVGEVRKYILAGKNSFVLINSFEIRSIQTALIDEIRVFGNIKLEKEEIKTNVSKAVKELLKINYIEPLAEVMENLEIKIMKEGKNDDYEGF